jgi:MFS family permease
MNPSSEKDEKSEPILNKEKEEDKDIIIEKPEKENKSPILDTNKENKDSIKKRKFSEKEKEDPILAAKRRKTIRDGILTLIGNEFHRISFGCLMVIFSLTTYLMSYLRHYQTEKTITLQYTYFIGPVMSITMGLFTPTVGMIENKLGLKLSLILGSLLNLWSVIILYLSKNYYIDLFAFFINSLGSSVGALLSRNLMGYFFHIRGKLAGILSVVGSFVSSAYNIIGEKWIVNPHSEEAVVDRSYYSFEVCENLLTYFKFCCFVLSIGTLLTVIFIVPYDKKKHIMLFAPKGFKGFDKSKMKQFDKPKMKQFDKKKVIKKEDIDQQKIGPIMPDDEKSEKKEAGINNEKIEEKKGNENKEEENIKIDEIVKKEIPKKDKKDKNKKDFSKTSSVPAFLVTNKDKLLFNSGIMENDESSEENDNIKIPLQKRRSQSISYKEINTAAKLPLINVIPEMEVVAVARPRPNRGKRNKFNIHFIMKALKSRRVLFLFLMGLFSAPLGNFLMSTWRPIGIRKGVPTRYLQNIGTYRPFITCATTLIFSTLTDYVPFRYLYVIFSVLSSIIGVTFCFTFNSPILFTCIILLNNVVFTGKMAITGPHYMKVFGLKYYIEIGGVIGLSRVFMSPLCTVFIFLFETYIAAPEGEKPVSDTPYIILFVTTGLLNIIAAVLGMFEGEDLYSPE